MIWFCYFCKNISFCFRCGPGGPPFLHKLDQKIAIFRGFSNFSRTTGYQLKLLILIESPNIFLWKLAKKIKKGVVLGQNFGQIRPNVVKKVKKQALSKDFFNILHGNTF